MKRAITQSTEAGAQGIKVRIGGRLGGREIARATMEHQGSVPLHTLRADVDYARSTAFTTSGTVGVKVWICHGEVEHPPGYGQPGT